MHFLLRCSWLFFFAVAAWAGETDATWRAVIDLQVVSVPMGRALPLVSRLREPAKFDAAFADLQQMIARDEASLVGWPVTVMDAASGMATSNNDLDTAKDRMASSKTYLEESSPSSYESQTGHGFTYSFDPRMSSPLNPHPGMPMPLSWAWTSGDFETRQAGLILDITELRVVGGNNFALKVEPNWVRLQRYMTFTGISKLHGLSGVMEQGEFVTARFTGTVVLHSGVRSLLASVVDAGPSPAIVLYLLKCSATRIESSPSP